MKKNNSKRFLMIFLAGLLVTISVYEVVYNTILPDDGIIKYVMIIGFYVINVLSLLIINNFSEKKGDRRLLKAMIVFLVISYIFMTTKPSYGYEYMFIANSYAAICSLALKIYLVLTFISCVKLLMTKNRLN